MIRAFAVLFPLTNQFVQFIDKLCIGFYLTKHESAPGFRQRQVRPQGYARFRTETQARREGRTGPERAQASRQPVLPVLPGAAFAGDRTHEQGAVERRRPPGAVQAGGDQAAGKQVERTQRGREEGKAGPLLGNT